MPLAIFVLSNDLHAKMFATVAAELDAMDWRSVGLPLDAWYDQAAATTASSLGLEVFVPDLTRTPPRIPFYDRPAPLIVLDAVHARGPIRRAITALDPSVVVVGNDRGLLEKAALEEARRFGARTVLVQDGTIGVRATQERTIRRRLWRAARRSLSILAGRLGLRSFVATEYGSWGCDRICVSGPAACRVFVERGVPEGRIIETGQPRYDGIIGSSVAGPSGIVWFTSPFAAQNLGSERQTAQVELVADVAAACASAGIPFAIRPHPREELHQYDRALNAGADARVGGDAAAVLAGAEAAMMSISTVVDEAAILGVPVMIPGGPMADPALDDLLPPTGRYPRVSSGADVVRLVTTWRANREERVAVLQRQHDWVHERIRIDPSEPASRRVAEVIRGLASGARS
jgi:hypothetical protein